jgi:hypothetical protein
VQRAGGVACVKNAYTLSPYHIHNEDTTTVGGEEDEVRAGLMDTAMSDLQAKIVAAHMFASEGVNLDDQPISAGDESVVSDQERLTYARFRQR